MKVLVVGSGIIGCRTILELLRRRIHVHFVSPRHPLHPSTCSFGAGGLWMPFHCDDSRTDGWSFATLSELLKVSNNNDNDNKEESLVETVPAVAFKRNSNCKLPDWTLNPKSKDLAFQYFTIDQLYTESKSKSFRLPQRSVIEEAGYTHAWLFQTPIVDCPNMLKRMLDEIKTHEYTDHVDVETNKYYTTIEEMIQDAMKLGCDGVVNCTGLGSSQLCNDSQLVGARGILLHYDRTSCEWTENEQQDMKESVVLIEEQPFGSDTHPCYMIPRGDIIAVGGTYLEGDEEKIIRKDEREMLLTNAQRLGIDTDKSKPVNEWVGFRPYRPESRLEVDKMLSSSSGVRVVHSYGYGGSGWTVYVGAARDAAELVLQAEQR